MLNQLKIQNFSLIDQLTIEFSEQLNILTGSTGAGKSIIIDALRFALGERVSGSIVREADKNCVVEAVFELSPSFSKEELFKEYLQDEDVLIINRQLLPDGKN